MKKFRIKREIYFILGMIFMLIMQNGITFAINYFDNYFSQCDKHYGYTTDYYTCRQYHLSK